LPAVAMIGSGAHNPPVQAAKADCSPGGKMLAGTQ
jgi:hypothetical protein